MTRSLARPAALLFQHLTPTGLSLPPDLGRESWRKFGAGLAGLAQATPWALVDWATYGLNRWGEETWQHIDELGIGRRTFMNYLRVGDHFPSARRRADLGFGHHEAVLVLKDERERDLWLERAVNEGLTREELRAKLRGLKETSGSDPPCNPHKCKCGATWDGQ